MIDTFKAALDDTIAAVQKCQVSKARLVAMYGDALSRAAIAEIENDSRSRRFDELRNVEWELDDLRMQHCKSEGLIDTLRAQVDELHATIVARNKTITKREAEIVEWQESYYELEARIAELEAAATWRPISEPPDGAGEYLGWNGYITECVRYRPEAEYDEIDWPWLDVNDIQVSISHWRPLPAPPTEAPAP